MNRLKIKAGSSSNASEKDILQSFVFIPYNKKWGVSQILGSVPALISLDQKCIIPLAETTSYLSRAISKCVSAKTAKKNKAKYVTFDVKYNERHSCYVIDQESFQLFYGDINQLGPLESVNVFLEIDTFVSPEGQVWSDENRYIDYASAKNFIYECSDGTLTKSYLDFKTWEKELALRPNNPNYEVLPYDKSLDEIEKYVVGWDGTIWIDATVLKEYLAWQKDPNHNYQDGYYKGTYGIANSFKEYAKRYNATCFLLRGLKRSEVYLDPTYHFLFSTSQLADEYINRIKSFQKKI